MPPRRKLIDVLRQWYRNLRLLNKIAIVLVLLALAIGPMGYMAGRPLYRKWKQQRLLAVAEACASRGEFTQALSAFKSAILASHNNIYCWTKYAEFLDANKSAYAVSVWERVAQLEPNKAEHWYRAATAALKYGDWQEARKNLDRVPAQGRNTSEYRLLDAKALLGADRKGEADLELSSLVAQQGPWGDAGFELDHLRFSSMNAAARDEAEARMRKRADTEGPYTTLALRSLISAEVARGNYELAASDTRRLIRRPDATGGDRVQLADLEFRIQSPSLQDSIQKALEAALDQPSLMGPLLAVLLKWGHAQSAVEWLESQPSEKLAPEPIRKARIMLALATHDSNKVFTLLGEGKQAPSKDVIANLRQIQAEFDAGNTEALAHWNLALKDAAYDPYRLYVMTSLAQAWNWPKAYETALWALADAAPENPAAWRTLISISLDQANTFKLLRAASGLIKADPSLRDARTLMLNLNFLLGQGDLTQQLAMAEADAADSTDIDTHLVYAALLAKVGRTRDAVAVADKIDNAPELGVLSRIYLGYIYAAAGNTAKARQWIVTDDAALQKILPEELDLAKRTSQIVQDLDLKASGIDIDSINAKSKAAPPPPSTSLLTEPGAVLNGSELNDEKTALPSIR